MPIDRPIAEDRDAPERLEGVAIALANRGWCVTDGFLPRLLVGQLAQEAGELRKSGGLRPAGVGRGKSFRIRPEIRTDRVKWLDPYECSGAQSLYLGALDDLRLAVNRTLFLGLFEYEGHFAVYPPGSRYRKHLDQFPGVEQRLVTCILYLNQGWGREDGGQLRIYTDPDHESRYQEVRPLQGRLVTFLSGRFLHEVMPARRDRLSITGWMKKRD